MTEPTTNETKGEVLRPCPFCNNHLVEIITDGENYNVACRNLQCIAGGPIRMTHLAAADAWNTRSHPTAEQVRGAAVELTEKCEAAMFPSVEAQLKEIEATLSRHFCHGDQRGGKRE